MAKKPKQVTTLFGMEPIQRAKPNHEESNGAARFIKGYVSMHEGATCFRISPGYIMRAGQIAPTGQDKGLPDLIVIHNGRFIGVEIKIGADRMSPIQKAVRDEILKAGGEYWEVKGYNDFKTRWDELYSTH